jgi:PAS fold
MDPNVATLVIGSDLRVRSSNSAWRQLGLAGQAKATGKRIDEVFPASDIRASILDVLASGESLEGVVIPVGAVGSQRYLCATLQPLSENGAKPREVAMQVGEFEGRIVVEGQGAEIVGMNEVAAKALGTSAAALRGKSVWALDSLGAERISGPYAQALEHRRPRYLGRFSFVSATGKRIELEGALVPVDT